jgi:hypothetical protein
MKIWTYKNDGWCACDADTYDGVEDAPNRNHVGRGDTEREAIAALIEIIEDSEFYDADEVAAAKAALGPDKRNGSPWDRGAADRCAGNPFTPHYWPGGTGKGIYIGKDGMTEAEIADYTAGWAENDN